MLIETIIAVLGTAVGAGVIYEGHRGSRSARLRAKPIEVRELEGEPTPPAQGAYRTPSERCPELLTYEDSFPPIASECPACGASLKLARCAGGHYSVKSVGHVCELSRCFLNLTETGTELVFCHAGQQVKGCKTKAPHMHQNCRRCGWQGLARTKKDIKEVA